MKHRHYDAIMAGMTELCQDSSCRHTNWGGRGRAHDVQPDCPAYMRELRKLEMLDEWEFTDARKALPRNDLNAKIKFDVKTGEVSMPLDAFLDISGHFRDNISYGLRQPDGFIYNLPLMPFKESRDLAEISGAQLMQKFDSKWIEA